MRIIEYKGVEYGPSKKYALIDALLADGWRIYFETVPKCSVRGDHVTCNALHCNDSVQTSSIDAFLALGKVVDEIKKAGAK